MKSKIGCLVLLASLLGLQTAAAQDYPTQPPPRYGEQKPFTMAAEPPGRLSDYILYRRSDSCYCPVGGNGPVQTELYLRNGASFPLGRGVFGDALGTGWMIQGGARVLFFDPPERRAWFLDASISNTWNQERNRTTTVPLSVLVPSPIPGFGPVRVNFGEGGVPPVTVRDLNRTFVNFGGGWLWNLGGPTEQGDWQARVGVDGGGRYGSGRARTVELESRSDVIYGAYVGAQFDMERNCGCGKFLAGVRAEYSYTWTDVFQAQNQTDFDEINLLVHLGLRY